MYKHQPKVRVVLQFDIEMFLLSPAKASRTSPIELGPKT
jgi:hypothetical protein